MEPSCPSYLLLKVTMPFFIEDETSQFTGYRQMVEGEFVLLNIPLDSVKCIPIGVQQI
jgi:hypothetical protein